MNGLVIQKPNHFLICRQTHLHYHTLIVWIQYVLHKLLANLQVEPMIFYHRKMESIVNTLASEVFGKHRIVLPINMICIKSKCPLAFDVTHAVTCHLSSIPITLMSFEPFFSHVRSLAIGTKCIPAI